MGVGVSKEHAQVRVTITAAALGEGLCVEMVGIVVAITIQSLSLG